jgi:hypothetical protein
MKHVLILHSDDCLDLYPNNKASDFRILLPKPLTLIGNWVCSLEEFYYLGNDLPKNVYVCCNIVEESVWPKIPLLHYIKGDKKQIILNPYEKSIRLDDVTLIHIYLLDEKLQLFHLDGKLTGVISIHNEPTNVHKTF